MRFIFSEWSPFEDFYVRVLMQIKEKGLISALRMFWNVALNGEREKKKFMI